MRFLQPIRFLHAADLHLGALFSGFRKLPQSIYEELHASGYAAFQRLVDVAIAEQVDFVILAGDIYDVEDHNLKAQVFFQKEMARLNHAVIPVFIVRGNHDFLNGSRYQLAMPENVYTFPARLESTELKTRTGATVELLGFSYDQRNISEKMASTYQKQGNCDYTIGILHGNLGGTTDHHNYAPFTLKELRDQQLDYWALGHIHKAEVLSTEPPVVYPGSLFGRSSKEHGEKGFYLVSLDGSHAEMTFVPAAEVLWQQETILITETLDFQELIATVQKRLQVSSENGKRLLLELHLDFSTCPEIDPGLLDEALLLEALQDEHDDFSNSFCWIYRLVLHTSKQQLQGPFFEEIDVLTNRMTIDELTEMLRPLFSHTTARNYVEQLDDASLRELLEEAKRALYLQWAGK